MGTNRLQPGVLYRYRDRLLDGAHAWGSFEVQLGRFGDRHYRQVVYPPGLTRSEHRWVRLARGWTAWGAALWLACHLALAGSMPGEALLGGATAVAVGACIAVAVLAGEARTRVHTLTVTTMGGFADPVAFATRDHIGDLATVMLTADERLANGEISPVDHELIWWQVYDRSRAATGRWPRRETTTG